MIVLAIDTCDSRGSVAVLRDGAVQQVLSHDSPEDYSSWLLPAVDRVLGAARVEMPELGAYAVASGPGSFTGLRLGLTTVKAWCEVYGKPVAAVSRLEALAAQAENGALCIATFLDAHRGQVFGAVYQRRGAGFFRLGEEMVIAPGKFVKLAAELVHGERVAWVSPDAPHILGEEAWRDRENRGESIQLVSSTLAPEIGRIGTRQLAEGRFMDALTLDANYVRRSDAEMLWKDARHGG